MISRGYFFGEIIDSLSSISQQVDTRCTLGLTDLNKYLENFFLYILNEALDLQLENINEKRCNAPGLDLVDKKNKIGFQVTSTKTSKKVNETLSAVLKMKERPDTVNILIIGKAQGSYSLEPNFCQEINFTEENIWDINTLCKKLVDLQIDKLQLIYEQIRKEFARVKIDLEIPNENGEYSTNLKSYVEQIQNSTTTDFFEYYSYQKSQGDSFNISIEEVQNDFHNFINELRSLPRISREFYAFLLERRDKSFDSDTYYRFNYLKLKRICKFPSLDEEIILLSEHGFADVYEPDQCKQSPYVRIHSGTLSRFFILEFVDYTESNGIGFTHTYDL